MKTKKNQSRINFEAFGVGIGLQSNDPELLQRIKKVLPEIIPNDLTYKSERSSTHEFEIRREEAKYLLWKDREELNYYFDEARVIDYLASQIRITIAEYAQSKVFVHAGAVVWKNYGIIIPGTSFSGKTTLVSELIKNGAEYYSDEYAVLDEEGLLHPYSKMLSMRGIINDFDQVDTSPKEFGAKVGEKAVPVKLVLVTQFQKEGVWKPQIIKAGEGMMEILQHTIPIRLKPSFVLDVLKKVSTSAVIVKTERGQAGVTAQKILSYIETI